MGIQHLFSHGYFLLVDFYFHILQARGSCLYHLKLLQFSQAIKQEFIQIAKNSTIINHKWTKQFEWLGLKEYNLLVLMIPEEKENRCLDFRRNHPLPYSLLKNKQNKLMKIAL